MTRVHTFQNKRWNVLLTMFFRKECLKNDWQGCKPLIFVSNNYTINDAKCVCREAILLSREEPELLTQVRFFFHSTGTCSYLTKPRDPSNTKDFHIFKSNPYIFDSKAALLLLVYLMYLIWQSWSSSQVVEVQTHRCLQRHLPQLKKTFQYLSVYFNAC